MNTPDFKPDPIMVNGTPEVDQMATGIRYVLLALASIASAMGFADVAGKFNALLIVAGPVAMAAVFVWGQLNTRAKSKRAATMAAALPNDVAQVK